MQRKLISQGGGGYTIYLPKKWIDSQKLKSGDLINIIEKENNLIISNSNIKKIDKETNLEIKSNEYHTYRSIIGGFYREGYTKINIFLKEKSYINLLNKIINSISGYEITEIKENTCIIKSLYETDSLEIKKYIDNMVNITKTIQNMIKEGMKTNNYDFEEEIFQYRSIILKHRDLIARTIIKNNMSKYFSFYQISYSLWNISRSYYTLFKNIEKKRYNEEIIESIKEIETYFDETFRKLKQKEIHSRHKKYNELRNKYINYLNKKKEPVVFGFLIMILSSIYSAESSLIALSLTN